MTRYWSVWPFHPEQQEFFRRAWEFDREQGCIAIGWGLAGDLSGLRLSEIEQRVIQAYPDAGPGATQMLWTFYNTVSTGDEIVAVGGRDRILALGTVTKTAFHDPILGQRRVGGPHKDMKPNFLGVRWHDLRPITLSTMQLSRWTLSEIDPTTYGQWTRYATAQSEPEPSEDLTQRRESLRVKEKTFEELKREYEQRVKDREEG